MELLKQAQTTRLLFVLFLGMIAAIRLEVGGIGIMNIMLASVIERTREIGIRRALGAKRRDITRQFLIESVVLSAVGGILGIVAGFACGPIIVTTRQLALQWFPEQLAGVPDTIMKMQPEMVGWSIPVAFLIAVGVGVLFGVYPARSAARLDPIEALRHE
jgi:putative ABC transport system permease protein